MARRRPHKLDLYRLAVQHPEAEVSFLLRAYTHYFDSHPTKLREDFCGTAAVSCAWVALDDQHRALAIDSHGPTVRWAQRRARKVLGEASRDVHILEADVHEISAPRVDVVAALNFSSFVFHTRESLRNYFRHARRSLLREGLLVVDVYGGPGAMRIQEQTRNVIPDQELDVMPFDYHWDQRSVDAVTARVDCRIHFTLHDGRTMRNAFRYNWRLWSLPELLELMKEAGFSRAEVWCDAYSSSKGMSDGAYDPMQTMAMREDWVAYLIGVR